MEARGDWFVPVLISDLRQTADKGMQAIVHPVASLSYRCPLQLVNPRSSLMLCFIHACRSEAGPTRSSRCFLSVRIVFGRLSYNCLWHPELAFQHIEQQFNCLLSPSIATLNILSKGKLDSRSVNIPLSLYGLNEDPEAVTSASEETPRWSCDLEDGGHTLVVTLYVPRLVCLLFLGGVRNFC